MFGARHLVASVAGGRSVASWQLARNAAVVAAAAQHIVHSRGAAALAVGGRATPSSHTPQRRQPACTYSTSRDTPPPTTPVGVDVAGEEAADLFNTATDLLSQGIETTAAIKMFLQALELKPEPSTYFNLAHAYLAANDAPKAMEALQASLVLDPAQSDALANLGTMLLKEGRFLEAAETLEKAIALDENDWTLRHMGGIAYEQAEELHLALAAYEKAKELKPELPDELIQNCKTKIKAKQALQEAIK